MGVLLKWKKITSEATYDQARIYRASGQTATYDLIHTQSIEDNSYYDSEGTGSYWYEVEFYDSVTTNVSAKSDPIQGGTYYGYCTVDDMRQVTSLKTSDINDTHLATLIEFSGVQLNNDMNIYHEDERVNYIDETKENEIDGANTTFYTKFYPLRDRNNDYMVTVSDINVYEIDSDGTKSELTVSQINVATGQFKLTTAPTSDKELYVTYSNTQRVVYPTDTLVRMGCIILTAAWAYSKINIGKAPRFKMGNLTVFRDTTAYHEYYKKYVILLAQINDRTYTQIRDGRNMPADVAYNDSFKDNSGTSTIL